MNETAMTASFSRLGTMSRRFHGLNLPIQGPWGEFPQDTILGNHGPINVSREETNDIRAFGAPDGADLAARRPDGLAPSIGWAGGDGEWWWLRQRTASRD